jgi:hypothetical protein
MIWRFPEMTSMKSSRIDSETQELAPIGIRALSIGAQSIGALAVGALAIGAVALGAVAIGRVVKKLRITDSLETPLDGGSESR